MVLDLITDNAIVYVLIAWLAILGTAKALRLENRGFEIKAYSLVYKNRSVQDLLTRMLSRMQRGIRFFADLSVVAGFAMMGFAFWFLLSNLSNFFIEVDDFVEVTVLIPGVTLTSSSSILYFLLSIPIVLVMHEGAHGIVATLEKIRIKTGGFAIFVALFAGFVEPDEEEFTKAKRISKLRVIGAGATANVAFSMVLGALLLTNPLFAIILPEPIVGFFYEEPDGMNVIDLIEGLGAERAGILAGDIITHIDGSRIATPVDFAELELQPGQTVEVAVLRGEEQLQFPVEIMPSPDDPERGLIGIMRDNTFAHKPVFGFIQWDPQLSLFLLWLWMISFFIGIINMLPLPILDGGKFIHSIIDQKVSERGVAGIMWGVYTLSFALFILNIALSYVKSGWFTI